MPRPTVTINLKAGQSDPIVGDDVLYDVIFSEPVDGFTDDCPTLSGSAGATTAALSGGPTSYVLTVSGMTTAGTVVATVGAGCATSIATGASSRSSTSTDNTADWEPGLAGPFSIWMDEEPGVNVQLSARYSLASRWTSSEAGVLVGFRWWSDDAGGGDYSMPPQMGLYNEAEVLLVDQDTSGVVPTGVGWTDAPLDEPFAIEADTVYWVVAFVPIGTLYHFQANAPVPTVNEPIICDQGGYSEDPTMSFPDALFTSLYGVDVQVMTVI